MPYNVRNRQPCRSCYADQVIPMNRLPVPTNDALRYPPAIPDRWHLAARIYLSMAVLIIAFPPLAETRTAAQSPDDPATAPDSTPVARVVSMPPMPAAQIASVFQKASQAGTDDATTAAENVDSDNDDTADSSEDVPLRRWIEQLGSTEFAAREQATVALRRIGQPALRSLRETAANHADIEVRTRASEIAEGIVQGEAAGRIDAFLAGREVPMDGWNVAKKILGDGVRIRELYVDLVMRHEDVAQSLNGSSSDRQTALRSAIVRIQRGMFVEQRLPTESDAIALLLLMNDRAVPTNRLDENALFSVLQKEASSLLFKDAQLSEPFRQLLAGWMTRDDVNNRQEILWFSMGWDLKEILPMAVATLQKANDPVTLSMACQAVVRFGSDDDIRHVRHLLVDERPVSEQQYSAQRFPSGVMVQTQVRDTAMAAVILLSGRKLSEFQMNDDARHPKYGFIIDEIGFPVKDPKPRTEVLQRIKTELLKDQPNT